MTPNHKHAGRSGIPLWLKIAYTAFVAVLVPYYWYSYGPTNFLYFCDVALLMTVVALWWESRLLISMAAVGILLPQTIWIIDFFTELAGRELTGMTAYMFEAERSLFVRGLSLFHLWLPLLLVWLVWRLGYDRRAFWAWTLLAWVLLLICYFFIPPPPAPTNNTNLPVNINYVYGLSDKQPQDWMPQELYFALLLVVLPAGVLLPTHLALSGWFTRNWADTDEGRDPSLAPLELPLPVPDALARVEAVVRTLPLWQIESVEPAAGTIKATRHTRLWKFVDDVTLRLEPVAGGSRLHARSKARVGAADLGQNRRNLLALFQALRRSLGPPAP
jgi:uncharacterized protein (DUF1499 family)